MARLFVQVWVILVSGGSLAAAAVPPIELDLQVEAQSTYLWRGLQMHKGASTDVTFEAQTNDFRLVGWADVDRANRRPFETDLAVEGRYASYSWGAIEGGVNRMAIRDRQVRHEAYITFLPENTWYPSVSAFVDLASGGVYVQSWVRQGFGNGRNYFMSFEAGLGLVHRNPALGTDQAGRSFTGFHDGYGNADLTLPSFMEQVECHVFLGVSLPVDARSRRCLARFNDGESVRWNGGIRFRFSNYFQ
jgi:hypothetical protein